jgi:hypothetical protein
VKLNLFLYVYLIFWVISILEIKIFLAGMNYPTSKIIRVGTTMSKILYPWVYMSNLIGRIFFDTYRYRMVLPNGYVSVAIPSRDP